MRLYFLRHGLADREEWSGPDFERPLTKRGKVFMERSADTLADLDLDLDLILTSPLARALQTAEIVANRLDMVDQLVQVEQLAPGFGLDELAHLLHTHSDAEAIMLVGHEPDFGEVIGALIGGGQVICKKGMLARVDVPSADWLEGELVWLIPPKLLRSASSVSAPV